MEVTTIRPVNQPPSIKKASEPKLIHRGGWANAKVWLVTDPDGILKVVKDFSQTVWIIRNTIGRFLISREVSFIKRLEGTGLVPGGVRRRSAFALEENFVEGPTLREFYPRKDGPTREIPAEVLLNLRAGLKKLREHHVAHLDLHNARNIIIYDGTRPVLIDWQSAIRTRFWPQPFRAIFHEVDRYALIKFTALMHPELLSDNDLKARKWFSFIRRKFWIPRIKLHK